MQLAGNNLRPCSHGSRPMHTNRYTLKSMKLTGGSTVHPPLVARFSCAAPCAGTAAVVAAADAAQHKRQPTVDAKSRTSLLVWLWWW